MKNEGLLDVAQARFTAVCNHHELVSSPDSFNFPLPHYKFTACVLVNNGRINNRNLLQKYRDTNGETRRRVYG